MARPLNSAQLKALIADELREVRDEHIAAIIRKSLVEPAMTMRPWSPEEPGQEYRCWSVFEDSMGSDANIAYWDGRASRSGPWGLFRMGQPVRSNSIFTEGTHHFFLDAFVQSPAAKRLPIWCVFRQLEGGGFVPVTDPHESEIAEDHGRRARAGSTGDRYWVFDLLRGANYWLWPKS